MFSAALIEIIKHKIAQSISIDLDEHPVIRELIARKNKIEIKYLKKSKNHPTDGAGYSQLLNDITVAKIHVHIKI